MSRRSHNPHRSILFSSASNPSVDTPLCRLPMDQEVEMLSLGRIRLLPGPYSPTTPRRYIKTYLDSIVRHVHAEKIFGSFNDAWSTRPSGYAGPLVMQMRSNRSDEHVE